MAPDNLQEETKHMIIKYAAISQGARVNANDPTAYDGVMQRKKLTKSMRSRVARVQLGNHYMRFPSCTGATRERYTVPELHGCNSGTITRGSRVARVQLRRTLIFRGFCLYGCLTVCMSVWPSVWLYVCMSVWRYVYLSALLYVCLAVCLYVYIYVCMSVCMAV